MSTYPEDNAYPADETAMVCVRADGKVTPVDGSMLTHCVRCGTPCWISQESATNHPEASPMCLECALPSLLSDEAEVPQPEGKLIVEALKVGWRPS